MQLARHEKRIVALCLVGCFALAAGSAAQKSVTVDEYQALPHGLAICKTGDFHLATGVPVLPSVLPALPLLATEARLFTANMPAYTSSWQCGLQFVVENGFERDPGSGRPLPSGRYHDYFLLGRLTSIAVLLLTCGLAYGYSRSLHGPIAGLLTLAVACLSPNLLAHGRLVTPDIFLAAAALGSLWAFDRLLLAPNCARSCTLGICLGLAALCKLTGLLLFVLIPFCSMCFWLADYLHSRRDTPIANRRQRIWPFLLLSLLVGVIVINAGYLFDGTCTSLGRFRFESVLMHRFAALLPAWLPVPLPRYFFQGIDAQLAESGYAAYLMGRFNETGFYSYYLVALLVKTPLPILLLCGLAWFRVGRPTRREMPLVVVAALMLLFFSLSRHKNIGVRYVLFLEPMMAIWIGRLLIDSAAPRTWLRRTVIVAVGCLAAVTLTSWPHFLPYFNWVSGGPAHGHRWLLDSNLDWGQDLVALRRYMEREGIEGIDLAHFGRVPPEVYGIRYRTLRAGERRQNPHVAISANLLWGLMNVVNGDLNYWPDDSDAYRAFRGLRPKAVLGHSIYVFEIADQEPGG
ncbi:MAG TPA: glycosyltransferase family 39 protein [Pirellulales bacterium]|nr:glycosyltransferase family 39 protein [Pirellulales bacterium]